MVNLRTELPTFDGKDGGAGWSAWSWRVRSIIEAKDLTKIVDNLSAGNTDQTANAEQVKAWKELSARMLSKLSGEAEAICRAANATQIHEILKALRGK